MTRRGFLVLDSDTCRVVFKLFVCIREKVICDGVYFLGMKKLFIFIKKE